MRFLQATIERGELAAQVATIIVNNRTAPVYEWAQKKALPVHHISAKTHPDKHQEDRAICSALQAADVQLVILSGYMKRIGAHTLNTFQGRILNIHPALLPKFGGQGMYGDHVHQAVLSAGEHTSGATVHHVTARYDEGSILAQSQVKIEPTDTLNTLRKKVQTLEGPLYLRVVQMWIKDWVHTE